jgi:hypothetical protein
MWNQVIIIGHLTKDPELRYTPQGTAVATYAWLLIEFGRARPEKKKKRFVLLPPLCGTSARRIAINILRKAPEYWLKEGCNHALGRRTELSNTL